MSPSEFELRDALHHGEGDANDVLDVSAIINRGEDIRRERRVRYLTTAAAAIVVAGVTTGVVLNNGGSSNSAGSGALRADTQYEQGGAGAGGANGDSSFGAAIPPKGSAGCTATRPAIGVPTDTGRSGSFFAKPVDAITVCAYAADGTQRSQLDSISGQRSTTLTGADAAAVARSLDDADTVQRVLPCPLMPVQLTLTLRPYYTDGTAGPLILSSVQPSCALPTTNGIVVRYGWTPPPVLQPFVQSVTQEALKAYATTPSGKGYPTPTNS